MWAEPVNSSAEHFGITTQATLQFQAIEATVLYETQPRGIIGIICHCMHVDIPTSPQITVGSFTPDAELSLGLTALNSRFLTLKVANRIQWFGMIWGFYSNGIDFSGLG